MFNIQRFCGEDGPGIRTCVFLKGCPLRCVWCHNPESQLPGPQFSFDRDRCLKCGSCFSACPQKAIDRFSPFPPANVCTKCEQCVEACPNGARQLIGWQVSVDELVDSVARDGGFYEESAGGVTFSGGEPLAQIEFVLESLKACREMGIHTALDTCGYAKTESLMAAAKYSDLILYDVKHADPARHEELTGVSNTLILNNLRKLAEEGADVWLRVPLIPSQNDDVASLHLMGAILSELPKRYPVWLLPYHRLGSQKHERLGMPTPVEFDPPSASHLEECAQILRGHGLDVRMRNP